MASRHVPVVVSVFILAWISSVAGSQDEKRDDAPLVRQDSTKPTTPLPPGRSLGTKMVSDSEVASPVVASAAAVGAAMSEAATSSAGAALDAAAGEASGVAAGEAAVASVALGDAGAKLGEDGRALIEAFAAAFLYAEAENSDAEIAKAYGAVKQKQAGRVRMGKGLKAPAEVYRAPPETMVPEYNLLEGMHCGGTSILKWNSTSEPSKYGQVEGYMNNTHECKHLCMQHEECAGFIWWGQNGACSHWKRGPLEPYAKSENGRNVCFMKLIKEEIAAIEGLNQLISNVGDLINGFRGKGNTSMGDAINGGADAVAGLLGSLGLGGTESATTGAHQIAGILDNISGGGQGGIGGVVALKNGQDVLKASQNAIGGFMRGFR